MTSSGYSLTTRTLTTEAATWDAEADKLASLPSALTALRLDRIQSGIFQLITAANDDLVNVLSQHAEEGSAEMHRIADGLRRTAQNYDRREMNVAGSIDALHG